MRDSPILRAGNCEKSSFFVEKYFWSGQLRKNLRRSSLSNMSGMQQFNMKYASVRKHGIKLGIFIGLSTKLLLISEMLKITKTTKKTISFAHIYYKDEVNIFSRNIEFNKEPARPSDTWSHVPEYGFFLFFLDFFQIRCWNQISITLYGVKPHLGEVTNYKFSKSFKDFLLLNSMALTDWNVILICDHEIWIFVTMKDCGSKNDKICQFYEKTV